MSSKTTRSDEVIEDFKKRQLATSAWHNINRLIKSFDEDRKADQNWAKIGMLLLFFLLVGLSIYFSGMTEINIS